MYFSLSLDHLADMYMPIKVQQEAINLVTNVSVCFCVWPGLAVVGNSGSFAMACVCADSVGPGLTPLGAPPSWGQCVHVWTFTVTLHSFTDVHAYFFP